MTFAAKVVIGAIQRGRLIVVPHGETRIQGGDILNIFTMAEDAEAIKKMFAQ
jgi:Trk K+ transport system NAD-binding subunit